MTDPDLKVYPILLAGGTGTRLWPVSRELYPKQLVKFVGEDSLLQATIKRLSPVLSPDNVKIVCGKQHFHETARQIENLGLALQGKLICEPSGRNTAPAILLAVLHILAIAKDAVLCVFPADHVIQDLEGFHDKLSAAIALARTSGSVQYLKLREVAGEMAIPLHYTQEILTILMRAGLAEARAGKQGGYRLIKDAREISLLDIVEAAEGPMRMQRCTLSGGPCHWNDTVCAVHSTWEEANRALRDSLSSQTLSRVVEADTRLRTGSDPASG